MIGSQLCAWNVEINHPDASGTWAAGVWDKIDKGLNAPTKTSVADIVPSRLQETTRLLMLASPLEYPCYVSRNSSS